MKRCFGLFLSVVFLIIPSVFAQESITISTYYPAPAGVFNQLLAEYMAIGDVSGDGQINAEDLAHTHDEKGNFMPAVGVLTVANIIGIGTNNPQGELYAKSAGNATGDANLILEGRNPKNNISAGTWAISVLGSSAGKNAGNLQFSSTIVDETGHPTGTTSPLTIKKGAPDNSIYVADNGNVGIGTDNPQATLDIHGDSAFLLPRFVADPSQANSINGMIYYNTKKNKFRVFQNGRWVNMGAGLDMVSGGFKGDSNSPRTFDVGFPIKMVIIIPHNEGPFPYLDNPVIKMTQWPVDGPMGDASMGKSGGSKWSPRYIKDTEGYDNPICNPPTCLPVNPRHDSDAGVQISGTTFTIIGIPLNTKSRSYSWIAFGWPDGVPGFVDYFSH